MQSFREDSTEHLISRIQEGETEAFRELFITYYEPLCRFAYRYVKSRAVSEELVQEVFTKIWDNRFQWSPRKVKTYLYQSVKHQALDYVKHQRVEQKYDKRWMDQKEFPTINFTDKEKEQQLNESIRRAIENLPKRGRMVYKLHRQDGLTYQEIAEVMDISVKTVESQMTRCLKKLRKQLSPYLT